MTGNENGTTANVSYGDTEFHGANVGGLMRVDDDNMRLGVLAADGETALLDIYLRSDPHFRRIERVDYGSVLVVGGYRVEVVTLGRQDVAVEVAKAIGS